MERLKRMVCLVVSLLLLGIVVYPGETEKASLAGKIAFIRESNIQESNIWWEGNIWLADADGTNQRQLTKDGNFSRPSWSPDGKYIVCERHFNIRKDRWNQLHWNPSVWLIDVEKIQAKRLTPDYYKSGWDVYALYATFSSDGRYVIFVRQEEPEDEGETTDYLIAVDLQTLEQTILAKESGWELPYFVFQSPCSVDGIKDIVHGEIPHEGGVGVSLFRFQSGIKKVWVQARGDPEGYDEEKLTMEFFAYIEDYSDPAISHDRQYIAATRFTLEADEKEELGYKEKYEICVIRIKDKDMRIFRLPYMLASTPSFSSDGRHIVFDISSEEQMEKNIGDIWIIDLESGNTRLLIKNGIEAAWSPR